MDKRKEWICSQCGRIFRKANQPHSCRTVPLEQHFAGKDEARTLFNFLIRQINKNIGGTKTISLPCCIHLFGQYDFLAALPKKDGLEIRFALNRRLDTPRLKVSVPMSSKVFKNCIDIYTREEINKELLNWLTESYQLKVEH